jgi:hypothetical protein
LKHECHLKIAVQLKEFIKLHAKLDADTLLKFAIHHTQNEHEVEKALM